VKTELTAAWQRFGPRARDVVFVLLGLQASFVATMVRRTDGVAVWLPVGAVAVVAASALWWRRQYPVTVALIGIAAVPVAGVPAAAFLALFSLAIRRRDRVLVGVAALAVVVLTITWSIGSEDSWGRLLVYAGGPVALAVAAGAYIGARHDLVAALRERAARAEAEQEVRADQARLAERSRIAREMHDVLAHKVSLIAMHAGALEVQAAPSPEQVAKSAELIRTTAHEAMEDLREVLGVLRAGTADGSDLTPSARTEDIARVVAASKAAGVHAELHLDVGELPDHVARTAHRVVREGLTNVHKHARGAATVVSVTGDDAVGVSVEVLNRRPAGRAALLPGSGVGLLGLRERVGLLGGTLDAGPCADGGWRLAAWIPWCPE
jgi:signal transduction histidine kinase